MRDEEYPFYGPLPGVFNKDESNAARRFRDWLRRLREREILECIITADGEEWDPAGDHIASDFFLLSISDMLEYGAQAGLTDKQNVAYTDWVIGISVTDIARGVLGGVTYQAAKEHLGLAFKKVGAAMEADRYHGWRLVYLEDVTRRKLF